MIRNRRRHRDRDDLELHPAGEQRDAVEHRRDAHDLGPHGHELVGDGAADGQHGDAHGAPSTRAETSAAASRSSTAAAPAAAAASAVRPGPGRPAASRPPSAAASPSARSARSTRRCPRPSATSTSSRPREGRREMTRGGRRLRYGPGRGIAAAAFVWLALALSAPAAHAQSFATSDLAGTWRLFQLATPTGNVSQASIRSYSGQVTFAVNGAVTAGSITEVSTDPNTGDPDQRGHPAHRRHAHLVGGRRPRRLDRARRRPRHARRARGAGPDHEVHDRRRLGHPRPGGSVHPRPARRRPDVQPRTTTWPTTATTTASTPTTRSRRRTRATAP